MTTATAEDQALGAALAETARTETDLHAAWEHCLDTLGRVVPAVVDHLHQSAPAASAELRAALRDATARVVESLAAARGRVELLAADSPICAALRQTPAVVRVEELLQASGYRPAQILLALITAASADEAVGRAIVSLYQARAAHRHAQHAVDAALVDALAALLEGPAPRRG